MRLTGKSHWVPVAEHLPPEVAGNPDQKRLKNWALVLSARNIPYQFIPEKNPKDISVPEKLLDISCREIKSFHEENKTTEKLPTTSLTIANNGLITASILILLGIFHNLTYLHFSGFGHSPIDWITLGSADSTKILAGQWWRVLTSLTLHADWQHLFGNLLIGGYFVVRLCQITGAGLGWMLILGAGAFGNLANAVFHGNGHDAVGASTAIFGAIGVAGALGATLTTHKSPRYWLLPLAAACALLAFLGAGTGKTDTGAHLFGFLCGIGLGFPAGRILVSKGQPGRTGNTLMSFSEILAILAAWVAALTAG